MFAFLAGLIDSMVGGGGLIQLPALFLCLPQHTPALLFGTNKMSSVAGTSMAVWQYAQRIDLPWNRLLPGACVALVSSLFGAWCMTLVKVEWMRPLIIVLLVLVAIYTYRKKDFGNVEAKKHLVFDLPGVPFLLLCSAIGYYDGFFGPGTGSFLLFALVGGFQCSFIMASAIAKVINLATNLGAIATFAATGNILFIYAIPMGCCNIAGAWLGTRLALKTETRWLRRLFLIVVWVFILKLAYDETLRLLTK
jgi:uncharacterized protein